MNLYRANIYSLKTRITLFTLGIFLLSIWSLNFYASRMLREDMQRLSGEQQFSSVTIMAAGVNEELENRLRTLEKVAGRITPELLGNPVALQAFLEERLILQDPFNGGSFVTDNDGTAIASLPRSVNRIGINYLERDHVAAALKEGKSRISKPAIGKMLHTPVISMAVPIRDLRGRVTGSLVGVTNLALPNFLDKFTQNHYGRTGGYFIASPRERINIAATDKSRVMQSLPAPEVSPSIDRFVKGYDGTLVYVNQLGVEVLVSAKHIPVSGWKMVASLPTSEAFAPIHELQHRMQRATVLLTLLAGALTWWMLRRELAPMLAAVKTLSTLSENNQPPQHLVVTRQDEIGELINGFNLLLDTLAQRENALLESKKTYQTLFHEMLDGFALHEIILDQCGVPSNYRFLAVNPAFERLTGLSANDITGRTVTEVLPATEPRWIQIYGTVALTGDTAFFQNYSAELNKHFEVTAFRPAPNQFACIFVDITDRKLSESYRELARDVLQILNEPEDLMISIRRVIDVITEKTGFDAVGIRLQDGDDYPYFEQNGFSPEFLREESSLVERFEDKVLCRDDTGSVSLECTCGLVISGTIEPGHPFFTSGGSFWINDTFPLLELHPEDDPRFHPRNRCINQGYASVALIPIRNKEQIVGLLQFNNRRKGSFTLDSVELLEGIASHIGSALMRKKVEEEKNRIEAQFQQTQKLESLGVLAGGIAHDFNNILSIILGHCYILEEDIDSGIDARSHVKQISASATRAADLCRQMLSYAGKSEMDQTSINLWLLIDENVKMLRSAIKKNITINLDLKYDVPEITGDSAQIQQVVMNLIINAAEAIHENTGVISISLAKMNFSDNADADFLGSVIPNGSYACLTVSDNGCGMDQDTQKRVFEPFFTTKFTGRGLGMSAVLGIIKSHDGFLQLSSSPGGGTTFKVYLPMDDNYEQSVVPCENTTVFSKKVHGTVLLVDDEEGLRLIGAALLKALGLTVLTAPDGLAALECFHQHESAIDLVLLDLLMPGMNGIETYRSLRSCSCTVPIVICSGYYSGEEMLAIIADDDCAAAIEKPYKPDQLRNTLLKYISNVEDTAID